MLAQPSQYPATAMMDSTTSRTGSDICTPTGPDMGRRISALSEAIQALPAHLRWAAANEAAIAAQAIGGTSGEGPKGRKVLKLVERAERSNLSIAAARGLSLARLGALWQRQSRAAGSAEPATRIFIGIRALNECFLVGRYEARSGGSAVYADQREDACLAHVVRPTAKELWRAWRDSVEPVLAWAGDGRTPLAKPALLTGLVRRAHEYAYYLAAFRELHAGGVDGPLGFSTAGIPAHAAVAAGIEAIYYQHGFLRRSLVFPDFCEVCALNRPEGEHLSRRLPGARVRIEPPPAARSGAPARGEHRRRLAVVGDYVEQDAEPAQQLIASCLARGIEVVVRPHPADAGGLWRRWGDVSGVEVDVGGTFAEFLERQRPAAVAAWYSTALLDAVLAGVPAVTFEQRNGDIVFPFQDMALGWPRRGEPVMALFESRAARDDAVQAARDFALGRDQGVAA